MRDMLLREARHERSDMLFQLGAGVDHRHLALADDIGAGALEGERAGIVGDDAPDARCDGFEPTVFEGNLATKGNLDSHGRFASGWGRAMCCHSRTGLSSRVGEREAPDEDQVRYRLHTRGIARLLRPA